jgi:hypothetical protein
VVATDIQRFKAECVNPPANTKSIEWIKAGFPAPSAIERSRRPARAMQQALTIVVDAVTYASWLFIVSLGLTLVFGVLKILNIAHGSV